MLDEAEVDPKLELDAVVFGSVGTRFDVDVGLVEVT